MMGPELCLLLVCLVPGSLARLSITSATPSGTIFRSGESMRLECSTNNPWFLCIWETPRKILHQTDFLSFFVVFRRSQLSVPAGERGRDPVLLRGPEGGSLRLRSDITHGHMVTIPS